MLARWRSRRVTQGLGLAALVLCVVAAEACGTHAAPDVEKTPRASAAATLPGFAVLGGNLVPMAAAELDVGRLDPATPLVGMSLLFTRSPEQKARSRAVLADLQDPVSPRYHQWWKPSDVAAVFGAASADLSSATAWLAAQGFTVHGPSPTATRLLFSGTAGQVEQAFHTEMHRYAVRGESHFALGVAPQVPTPLARFVGGLRGVHDFQLHPASHARAVRPTPEFLEDAGPGTQTLTLGPADFAAIYDIDSLYGAGITGSGQKIGVVGACDFNDADIAAFRTTFGLDPSLLPVRDLVPMSGAAAVNSPDYFGETELDLEWSGGIANEATIYYVYTGNNPAYGPFDAIVWAIEEGTYPILTSSYAGCEQGLVPSENIYLEDLGDAAAMEGITVLNASGDWGPASCDGEIDNDELAATLGISPTWPSSIPSIVAVGGTMLSWGDAFPQPKVTATVAAAAPFDTYWNCTFTGTADCSPVTPPGYIPESAWNEMSYEVPALHYFWGAGGGGTSTLFAKPYWQIGQTPAGTMRLLPDVSVTAAWQEVGFVVSQSWTAADGSERPVEAEALAISGGTSAATPSFAGILALVNQALLAKYPSRPVGLGNANPVLYAINASTEGGAAPAFHDITTGNTYVPCKAGTPDCPTSAPYQYGFAAGPGYDLATGIGSVDVKNLVDAWTTLTPTSTALVVTPSGTKEGSKVTVTATVSSTATTNAMTGSVVFYVDTVDEAGLADLSLAATATLSATVTGGHEGGTATTSLVVPPGLLDQAHVVAFYGGDVHYLASWSSEASITATSSFAITPTAVTVAPNAQTTFTASGGVLPAQWTIERDTTCNDKNVCAAIESLTATTGAYQAGPEDGYTIIAGIDKDGAEARATVTVSGAAVDGGILPAPWDGGGFDSGIVDASADVPLPDSTSGLDVQVDAPSDGEGTDGAVDARADATMNGEPPSTDAGTKDASTTREPADSSGCGCRTAGAPTSSGRGGALGLLLACAFARRRRRARMPIRSW